MGAGAQARESRRPWPRAGQAQGSLQVIRASTRERKFYMGFPMQRTCKGEQGRRGYAGREGELGAAGEPGGQLLAPEFISTPMPCGPPQLSSAGQWPDDLVPLVGG